jgi:kumamolisin
VRSQVSQTANRKSQVTSHKSQVAGRCQTRSRLDLRLHRFLAASLILAGSLSACGSLAGSQPPVRTLATCDLRLATGPGANPATCDSPLGQIIARSRDLGPVSLRTTVTVTVSLKDPLATLRAARVAAMYRPGSSYMRFQSWKDLQSESSPRLLAHRVQSFFHGHGLTARWLPGDSWMAVSGSAPDVEAAFRVRLHSYQSSTGVQYYASLRTPRIPAALRNAVIGIGRISNYPFVRTASIPAGGLKPADLLSVYGMNPPASIHLDGAGQTVAVVEIDGFAQSDLDAFSDKFHLPRFRLQIKFGPPLPAGGETEMDVEVIHAIAPKATITVYNCANPCSNSSLLTAIDAAIKGTPHGVISMSLIGCELNDSQADISAIATTENKAAAEGTSFYISTGDSGAYECLTNDWSSPPVPKYITVSDLSDPANVTAVGGTRVSLNKDGTRYREEVWENPAQTSGPGGGVSTLLPIPDYQRSVLQAQDNPNNMRQQPDVSADADPATGAAINVQGTFTQGGGTSQAAPIWAGLTVLIDQYLLSKNLPVAGFVNPALYALASGHPRYPPFYDVTVGSNLHYAAKPGYDLATGLGTPNAWNLARDLEQYIKNGGR